MKLKREEVFGLNESPERIRSEIIFPIIANALE
jgi:hypothetical protein